MQEFLYIISYKVLTEAVPLELEGPPGPVSRGALRLPGGAKTVRGTANDVFGHSRLPGKGLKMYDTLDYVEGFLFRFVI